MCTLHGRTYLRPGKNHQTRLGLCVGPWSPLLWAFLFEGLCLFHHYTPGTMKDGQPGSAQWVWLIGWLVRWTQFLLYTFRKKRFYHWSKWWSTKPSTISLGRHKPRERMVSPQQSPQNQSVSSSPEDALDEALFLFLFPLLWYRILWSLSWGLLF